MVVVWLHVLADIAVGIVVQVVVDVVVVVVVELFLASILQYRLSQPHLAMLWVVWLLLLM